MSSDSDSHSGEKPSIGGDLIIPAAAIVFTLYYFYSIVGAPWTAQVSAFFNGSILLLLCVIFIATAAVKVMRRQATLRLDTLVEPIAILPKRILLFFLTLGYVACLDWAGFTITTFVFLALAMMLLSGRERKNKRVILILSGALAIGGYLLFVVAFERQFPEGPFEHAVKAVTKAVGGS